MQAYGCICRCLAIMNAGTAAGKYTAFTPSLLPALSNTKATSLPESGPGQLHIRTVQQLVGYLLYLSERSLGPDEQRRLASSGGLACELASLKPANHRIGESGGRERLSGAWSALLDGCCLRFRQ